MFNVFIFPSKITQMLVEFSVQNFLSFKEKATLNLVASNSFKEHTSTQMLKIDEDVSLLKSSAIFGANASGKSNLIRAVGFLKSFVKFSFADSLKDDEEIRIEPFKLNSSTEKGPSTFEVIFFVKDELYRYGFSANTKEIVKEYLFRTIERETPLFQRDFQNIEVNKKSFKEGKGLEDKARKNVLFLSLIAQLNGKISNAIIDWFNNLNVILGLQDRAYKKYTINKLKNDKEFRKWVSNFVDFLEIEKVTSETTELPVKSPISDDDYSNDLIQTVTERDEKSDVLAIWHRKYDENNLLIDTIPFPLKNQESEGTEKFIYLLGPWYDTIVNEKILFIDELDSRLHTLLTRRLIEYFSLQTKSKGQILFALHDTNLLDRDLFRRDQIWFVEKDQYGASDLYSLADYKSVRVKSNTNFEKHYIAGKYGAIPYFGDTEKLNQLVNG